MPPLRSVRFIYTTNFGAHGFVIDQLGQRIHLAIDIDQHIGPLAGGQDVALLCQGLHEGLRIVARAAEDQCVDAWQAVGSSSTFRNRSPVGRASPYSQRASVPSSTVRLWAMAFRDRPRHRRQA